MSGHVIPDVLQKKLKMSSQNVFTNSKVIFIGEQVSNMYTEKVSKEAIPNDQLSPSDRLRGLGVKKTETE